MTPRLVFFELRTPDVATSTDFLSHALGWTAERRGETTRLRAGARSVASVGRSDGRTGWVPRFEVADREMARERAFRLGGDLDAGGDGLRVADPSGAEATLVGPGTADDGDRATRSGHVVWTELVARDPEGAGAFWAEVLDGRARRIELPVAGAYVVIGGSGGPLVGCCELAPDSSDAPHWIPSAAVRDVDASFALTLDRGARPLAHPTDLSPFGRYALVRAPDGAPLGLCSSRSPFRT